MASINTRAKAPRVENWTADQSVGSGSWTIVWATTESSVHPATFVKAVLQNNTFKMLLKVTVTDEDDNSDTLLDVDLEELDKDFQLSKDNGIEFPIMKYQSSNLWIYCPSHPIAIPSGSQMKIEMKSKAGTKKCVRGMSEWGAL